MARHTPQAWPGDGAPAPRRPLVVFGPGLVIAVLVIGLLVWSGWLPLLRAAPQVEGARVETSQPVPASAPEPHWVLSHRGDLMLRRSQVVQLQRRVARWDEDTRALREALDREAFRVQQALILGGSRAAAPARAEATSEARRPQPPRTLEQMQELAAPLSELSRELSQARHTWWAEAARVLTSDQRHRTKQLWAAYLNRPLRDQESTQ